MDATRRLPPELVEHARAFASGDRIPVPPRDAATVVLLRPDPTGMQAYLLRRHRGMPFAGGMVAFPGGGVDPRDSDGVTTWTGPPVSAFARRLGCDDALAHALVCAAVRETFEESGVLLAGPTPDSVVDDTAGEEWESDRQALVDRSLAFTDFLDQRELVLRADLLAPWAHWVTPEFEPRRYDTRFFVAMLPPGQRTRDVSGEADQVRWMRPAEATNAVDEGVIRMLPPTYVTLAQLAEYATPPEALAGAADRQIRTIQPGVHVEDDQAWLVVDL
ncbi:MAG TPA: NUDIX hydrolase [Nocardioidaceae bacterium]|nr:NUDIX hydrolase [Nocardioidaceae bacterium]